MELLVTAGKAVQIMPLTLRHELPVIAAKASQMMLLRHETACLALPWTAKGYSRKAVQMMPLRHETARYSRKSRPNDASEARNFSL